MSAVMAATAATAYDQAQDAGGSESSDLELDDAPPIHPPYISFYGRLYGGNMCNVKT